MIIFSSDHTYIRYSLAALYLVLHPGECVVVRRDVGDNRLLVRPGGVHIFRVQQPRYAELRVRDVEGMIEIIDVSVLLQFRPIDQIRSVSVYESVKTKAISPGPCSLGRKNEKIS